MRVWWLLLVLGGCETCAGIVDNEDRCESVERHGSCSSDSECVLGFCASACCDSTEACSAPMAFARRDLDKHDCLYEVGGTVDDAVCRKSTDCLCDTCDPPVLAPRCIDGRCSSVEVDAGR